MSTVESRLNKLGISLAAPPKPVAAYVPYTISGNQVFVSGQVPVSDGALKYVGKLGADFSVEVGQAAAQLCAINILSVLKEACEGDLEGRNCTVQGLDGCIAEGKDGIGRKCDKDATKRGGSGCHLSES